MRSLKTLAIVAALVIGAYGASTTVARAKSGLVWVHCDDGSTTVRYIAALVFARGLRDGCKLLGTGLDTALRRACKVKKQFPIYTWPQHGNLVAGKMWTCKDQSG